ncbi:voltage-dependent calcium channel subunit alpha-2/delta-3-like [Mya arenaria]|uniref:voltage-dependent calcium channel subunit alpha-2/delta-3-like n=1 Tax=Mya arenaria TaxID=6604 RepID=UPI0022E8F162|nr:voltage-dependent calcium channel subunit alpha-2/delta-3-like [Mya arenaria]
MSRFPLRPDMWLTGCLATLLLVLAAFVVSGDLAPDGRPTISVPQVLQWSRTLSIQLKRLTEGSTAFNNIKQLYHRHSKLEVSGGKIIDEIAQDIEQLLNHKAEAVWDLVNEAEGIYENYTADDDLNYEYMNAKSVRSEEEVHVMSDSEHMGVSEMVLEAPTLPLSPDSRFNNMLVNHENSTVHVPTNVYDKFPRIVNGAYWTSRLDTTFRGNLQRIPTIKWQYFCSSDGFFRVFPGMKWPRNNEASGIDLYDCRVRTWYLQAATCPKNVVILLDASGSMKGQRMIIASSTVKHMLNTLDDDDYFNIIRFSDKVEYVDPCFNGTMMQANVRNKRKLQQLVDENTDTGEKANFGIAFEEAFRLLNQERYERGGRPLCNKAILLITDGVPEHYAHVFQENNWPHKSTRVFTFLIGREVGDVREIRWMACANKGYFSHISTLADVQENVQNYIRVLSRPMVINRYHNRIWTSVYLDHMSALNRKEGLQFMTSVSIPVLDMKNTTLGEGHLLGVMGTDIPIASLKDLAPTYKLGANGYAFVINNNGYVLLHPDFRPYRKSPKTKQTFLNPLYQNLDILEVANADNKQQFRDIVVEMLSTKGGSSDEVYMWTFYDNMKRMVKRNYQVYYRKIANTNFSIGVALPPTSLLNLTLGAISPNAILNELTACFNENNVEIAPWRYCRDLDPKLQGKEREQALLKLIEKDINLCEIQLLRDLIYDYRNLRNISLLWGQQGVSFPRTSGVRLVFIGTKNGMTKYVSNSPGAPGFILNNTDTLEAVYYRRAIEGVERMDKQPQYNFTYSVPIGKVFNASLTRVTVAVPITREEQHLVNKFIVAGVVGMQMTYELFYDVMNRSTSRSASSRFCPPGALDCDIVACWSGKLKCYLVDNHGYVVASKSPRGEVGKFFGDVENGVMAGLVTQGVFYGHNFTDYQAICDITAFETESSAASLLLNPLKALVHTISWFVVEIVIMFAEFSVSNFFSSVHSQLEEMDYGEFEHNCSTFQADYDYDTLRGGEKIIYNQQLKRLCEHGNTMEQVVGFRPCHKTFTLYKANLVAFWYRRSKAVSGNVSGCSFHEVGNCDYDPMNPPNPDEEGCTMVTKECLTNWVASHVEDTNMVLVVVDATCNKCQDSDTPDYDFRLAHREITYGEEEVCSERRRRGAHLPHRAHTCTDTSSEEDRLNCRGCFIVPSGHLLVTIVLLSAWLQPL